MNAVEQRKIGFSYLVLVILFVGIWGVLGAYLPSYWQVWNIPRWGSYIVLGSILSLACALIAFSALSRFPGGLLALLGLTLVLFLLDIYVAGAALAGSNPAGEVTLAVPVALLHAYLLFLLTKSLVLQQKQRP
ncbi:MAG: hypothetical protein ACYDHM_14100 [Acidiferrobacterales bacterium]